MSYSHYDFDFDDVDDLGRQADALLRMDEDAQTLYDQLGDEVEGMVSAREALDDHIDTAQEYRLKLEDRFHVS